MATNGPMILSRRRRVYALEMIEFQNDNEFGHKLEAVVTEIYAKIDSGVKEKDLEHDELGKKFVKLVKDRTGMSLTLEMASPYQAAIFPFYANRNHIFLHEVFRGGVIRDEQIKTLARAKKDFGTVNTEKVYVTGSFADADNILYMNYTLLRDKYKMTIPEVTAIVLHELGHVFYGYEYADRLETSNFIIMDAMKHAVGRKEKADKKYVYLELERAGIKIDPSEIDALCSDDKVIAGRNWFELYVGHVSSQQPERTYDKTSFESLADNFASRFGYGRELVTGLDKYHKGDWFGYPSNANMIMVNMYWSIRALLLFVNTMAVLKMIALGSVFAWFGLLQVIAVSHSISSGSRTDKRDMTYDELKDRYKRIRNQFIENLKDPALDDKLVKESIESVKIVDASIKQMSTIPQINRVLADILSAKSRRAANGVKDQRFIEDLISNDLFLKSAQLNAQE